MPDKRRIEAIYDAVLVKDPADELNIKTHINHQHPDARDAFNKAARGIDPVTPELLSTLTGRKVHLYRSNPDDKTEYNFRPEITSILDRQYDKIYKRREFSAAEDAQLDQDIKALAQKSGIGVKLSLIHWIRTTPSGIIGWPREMLFRIRMGPILMTQPLFSVSRKLPENKLILKNLLKKKEDSPIKSITNSQKTVRIKEKSKPDTSSMPRSVCWKKMPPRERKNIQECLSQRRKRNKS